MSGPAIISVITSHDLVLQISLTVSQSNHKQNGTKDNELQPLQLFPIISCIVVGHVRVIVVVIVIYASFPLPPCIPRK